MALTCCMVAVTLKLSFGMVDGASPGQLLEGRLVGVLCLRSGAGL